MNIRAVTGVLLCAAFATDAVCAQFDALDPAFGTHGQGWESREFPFGDAYSYAVALNAGGGFVLAGGSDDANGKQSGASAVFSADGVSLPSPTLYPRPVGANGALWNATAVLADQGTMFAGYAYGGQNFGGERVFICRTNAQGLLDQSFGDPALPGCAIYMSGVAYAIAMQATGRILVAGYSDSPNRPFLMALMPDGSLDTSFGGGDGIAGLPPNFMQPGGFRAIAIAQDDAIAVAGDYGVTGEQHMLVARYTPDGLPLQSFSIDGVQLVQFLQLSQGKRVSFANDVYVDSNGAVTVAGNTLMDAATYRYLPAVARLLPDGQPDASFGDPDLPAGHVVLNPCATALCNVRASTEMLADGRMLIGGSGTLYGGDLDLAMIFALRLTVDGKIDVTYGNNDSALAPGVAGVFWPDASEFYSSALQGDRLVLAGSVIQNGTSRVAVIRFRGDAIFSDDFEPD